jgi:hypothetical protein
MSAPLWRPQQWDAHVPPDLKEPFPSAHPNSRQGIHPFSNPRNTALFGVALVLMGVVIAAGAVSRFAGTGEAGALVVGSMMLLGLGAVGAFGIHVGLARLRWIRRFREAYGFSPFDRQPGEVDLHRPGR